jgi:L-alanine-DL-glutamate epimerase-like enolase superfamily enzyme
VSIERFPIAGRFTIARGSRTEAIVVTASIVAGRHIGRGECVPYSRYGETPDGVVAEIERMAGPVEKCLSRADLQHAMSAGAARNAIDCALWDLEAKERGIRVATLAGIANPRPQLTAYTISLGTEQEMHAAAKLNAFWPVLKLKLGGAGDPQRIRAVRAAAPHALLIVDANEAWRAEMLEENIAACVEAGVRLIEQPLPANDDACLASFHSPVPLCADESLHTRAELRQLKGLYAAVNVKLDKTGGLTEALALVREARAQGFQIMVGCMVATSLSMAPAVIAAQGADFVDLDGPLLLAADRESPLVYADGTVGLPSPALWGA